MGKNNLVVEKDQLAYSMSRVFDAPRERVWRMLTDPQRIPEWWGPRNLITMVEHLDFKEGGAWRFVQTDPDGNVHPFYGTYLEIVPFERTVSTFEYEPFAGHVSTETLTLEDLPDGKTRVMARTTFKNLEDLEGMLQSGMEGGATESWDRLEELLAVGAGSVRPQ